VATLTTQVINRAGTVVTPVSATGGGDAAPVGSGMMLEVVNGGGSPITVTLAIPAGASGYPNVAYTSTAVSVTNGTTKWIGPLAAPLYADPTTGLCTITYSAVTSVTVAAVQLAQP
jgi:hypothetical protein